MTVYAGKHPVFTSHAKEVEQMAYFAADLQHREEQKGNCSGEAYECLKNVRRRCADLLLRLYAEDDKIILMDDNDAWWVRKIVGYVHDVILQDQRKAR